MISAPSEERRPDPDALLSQTSGQRGRLTVFLGAAPGVGKTYAMLARAGRLRSAGQDIVVGLVETHGRAETAALLEGLEVLPRRIVEHRGHRTEEFDIDAALARRPSTLIVDEMAHSNPDGNRHPKRWQDIDELVGAGIDVWTALNIQHLESLSDVVAQISGVRVREIVPDSALKKADEVILVDLPPAELIERLKEGKVYLPDNAQRAMAGFFRPATLTALRDLALRRTADRVDDQMVEFLRVNAIEGPWATAERLLVLVGADALSDKVVRTASRLASGLNAPWTALALSRPDAAPDALVAQRADATARLVERLGGTLLRATTDDFVGEILRVARRQNVTQIVIGRPRRALLSRWHRRTLADELLARSGDVNVHIVSGEVGGRQAADKRITPNMGVSPRHVAEATALATGAAAGATLVGTSLTTFLQLQNVSLLFLLAVVVCGVFHGRLSAVVAAGLSALAYNFFFIEPLYTFTIAQPHEVFALVVLLAAALLAGELAGRMREQRERARRQEQATQALNAFSRKLSGSARLETVLEATTAHLFSSTGRGAVLLMPEDGELNVGSIWPPDLALDATDLTAARWAFDKKEPSGYATGTLPQIGWHFRPILQGALATGVVGLARLSDGNPLLPSEDQLVRGILEQTTVAIDRARLARENVRVAALEASDKLNAALFSSLSHDLKTPLATISGAASSLRELGDRMDPNTRDDLLTSIEEEASRLGRFVSNLFDITRIESGSLKPRIESSDLAEAVHFAVDRAKRLHPGHSFEISLAPDLPPARADGNLLNQVLFNLIDNACKYGGDAGPVSIFARREGMVVVISVTDQGKGIPTADLERVFEKFYRRTRGDGRAAGTGLGLSIARGFVEAMGGSLRAESPASRKRGTRMVIRLPAEESRPR